MALKSGSATNAELAVLSLLAEQPMHGYQIEQTIEARGMREWTEIGFSSIYYILEKLRRRGSVRRRMQSAEGKGPARQVFSLTPAGLEVFRQAALNALTHPSRTFSNFQLGLAAIPLINKINVLEALRAYQVFLQDKKSALETKRAEFGSSLPWYAAALFDLDFAQLQCDLDWLKGFISTTLEANPS